RPRHRQLPCCVGSAVSGASGTPFVVGAGNHGMIHRTSLLAALAVFTAVLAACGASDSRNAAEDRRQQRIPAVEAGQVVRGTLPLEERLAGSVRARNQTEIYAEVSAPIVEVLVNDGDVVKTGDPLVRLRANDIEERVRQAESGV